MGKIDAADEIAGNPPCWLEIVHRPVGRKTFVVLRTADGEVLRLVKNKILARLATHAAEARAERPVVAMWEEAELAKLEMVLGELIPEVGHGPADAI